MIKIMDLYVSQSNLLCQLWCLCNSNKIIFFSQSLQPIDEFFLFMTYLSLGLMQKDLAHRFRIHGNQL